MGEYRWYLKRNQIKDIVSKSYQIGKTYVISYKFPFDDFRKKYLMKVIQKTEYFAVFEERETGLVACVPWDALPAAQLDRCRPR